MAEGGPGATIQIPRWIQLVGLPVLLVLAFMLARPLGHVLFLFLTASVIAFLLSPLVRRLERLRFPHGLGVAIVFLGFAAVVGVGLTVLSLVVIDQTREAAERIDAYISDESGATGRTGAEEDIDRLQGWLDDHGLEGIRLEQQLNEWVDSIGAGDISGYTQDAISFAQGAAVSVVLLLFSVILIIVIAVYMLLAMPGL
jgi:predicted PurR-regulated permease PerM